MKKNTLAILVIVLILSLMAACAPTALPKVETVHLTDGLGRAVDLPVNPAKIISLASSNTEILFAVGAAGQLVGRDEFSDFPETAKEITSIGGSMGKYNLEQIAALEPDLILAAEINTPEQVKAFEELNLNVYYLSNPKDFEGLYQNIEIVGLLSGHEKEAVDLVSNLKTRVESVLASGKDAASVKVFYELDGSDPAKPWTAGKGTYIDTFLTMTGAENIASSAGEGWLQMSQEAIIAANPDFILLGDAAYGVSPESIGQRSGWAEINAVVNNQVIAFDDNLVSRPGPRLVDGLEALAKILIK